MALFGKRKRAAGSASTALGTIIVPRKATQGEPWELVQAIVNYVNSQMENGLFRHNELPPKALQAYHADYYLAQVNNGGHSQFIHNSRQYAETTWRNAHIGLVSMGADGQADLIHQMMTWAAANPAEMEAQTGFEGGRADLLDHLDDLFYDLEKTATITDFAAEWIRGWPELLVVDDEKYETVLRETAALNPQREARMIGRSIAGKHGQLTDHLHVAFGLASSGGENVEVLLGIGGGSHMDVEGENVMVWTIQTSQGKRFVRAWEGGARLYEHVQPNPGPEIDHANLEASFEAFRNSNYEPATVGARLSDISDQDVLEVAKRAEATKVGAGVDLVLRRAGLDPEGVRLTALRPDRIENDRPLLIVLVPIGSTLYHVGVFEGGCSLMKFGDPTKLAMASKQDIETHWTQVSA